MNIENTEEICIDKIIFEAPLHKSFVSLSKHFNMTPFKFKKQLQKKRKLRLIRMIINLSKGVDPLEIPEKVSVKDITGLSFGRLTVVRRDQNWLCLKGRANSSWQCACECGALVIRKRSQLRQGHALQCLDCKKRNNKIKPRVNPILNYEKKEKNKVLHQCHGASIHH